MKLYSALPLSLVVFTLASASLNPCSAQTRTPPPVIAAFEPALNLRDDVFVCSRKIPPAADGSGAHRFEIFAILQSSRIAYFESERGEIGTYDYQSFIAMGETLTVQHPSSKASTPTTRTLSIDLRWATGKENRKFKTQRIDRLPLLREFLDLQPDADPKLAPTDRNHPDAAPLSGGMPVRLSTTNSPIN